MPGLYRVLPGLVPNFPVLIQFYLVFLTVSSPCPYRVHTASSEICNVALKYLLLLWNMYFCHEICTAALKYVLLHQNISCHSEICYSDGMHTLANHHHTVFCTVWAPPHERINNGLVPAPRPLTVLIPGSHRVPPLVPTRRKVLSMSKTFAGSRRISPAANGPPTCSPPRRVPSPCSTVHTKFTTRWHTVGLAGAMWQLHNRLSISSPCQLYVKLEINIKGHH